MEGFFKADPLAPVLAQNRRNLEAQKQAKADAQAAEEARIVESKLRGTLALLNAERLLVHEIMDELEGLKPTRLSAPENKALRKEFRDKHYKKNVEATKHIKAKDL